LYIHKVREPKAEVFNELMDLGISPSVAKILASRGVDPTKVLDVGKASSLIDPAKMKGIHNAASIITGALIKNQKIVVVGDYDCDGATATAIAIRGLRLIAASMGKTKEQAQANIDFCVPNRFEFGYGLSPEIVRFVKEGYNPDLIITVDNGISSVEGVSVAQSLGMKVVVTDHHLPGDHIPEADAIVNPNQPGCDFPSKSMAGCGVMFYVLLYLRSLLRENELIKDTPPKLESLLDIVALGTVADVVKLDENNRTLVSMGLKRIRGGAMSEGVRALFNVAGKDPSRATPQDFGFGLGPRLNAAGRLADMSLGIQCLITEDSFEAERLADSLNEINLNRKAIESEMRSEAESAIQDFKMAESKFGMVVAKEGWHHGVIGIIASRIKDAVYRPTIVLAPEEGTPYYRGSGRSIPGVHLRDVLDLVTKRMTPGAIPKFGGHAMAAGMTIVKEYLQEFEAQFDAAVYEMGDTGCFAEVVETDGGLNASDINRKLVDELGTQVWGQGFPPPLFSDTFIVKSQKILKEKHTKLLLEKDGRGFNAVMWNYTGSLNGTINLSYRVEADDFRGGDAIQLMIDKVLLNPNPELAQANKSLTNKTKTRTFAGMG
tara:strand:+ start:561 stop:2372 length:1812 start_codon:yes stop_codon:yes gene_type:complete